MKRRVRQIARQYVKLLRSQDMPDWPIELGLIDDGDDASLSEFMDEVRRIADRIDRSITEAGRAAPSEEKGR